MREMAMYLDELSAALRGLSFTASRVAAVMRACGEQFELLRQILLVTTAGEWPDSFILLNRYVRTGHEPDC